MKKIKNYDNVFKQTILKLYENGKSLKELSREYGVSTQSISTWKRNSQKIGLEKGKDVAYEELLELRKKVKDLERDNDILKGLSHICPITRKRIIHSLDTGIINIKRSCELFEISKSSYYKFKSKKESLRSRKRKLDVLEIKKEFLGKKWIEPQN